MGPGRKKTSEQVSPQGSVGIHLQTEVRGAGGSGEPRAAAQQKKCNDCQCGHGLTHLGDSK